MLYANHYVTIKGKEYMDGLLEDIKKEGVN